MPTAAYPLGRSYRSSARLNFQHFFWKRWHGYLISPRIALPAKPCIADLGTGTGVWLIDVAHELPNCERLDGFDITLAQCPHPKWLPDNMNMYTYDVLTPPPAEFQARYDLVNIRALICILREKSIPTVAEHVKQMLKPGGFVQWNELNPYTMRIEKTSDDIKIPNIEKVMAYHISYLKGCAGPEPGWVVKLDEMVRSCGLKEVHLHRMETPRVDMANFFDIILLCVEEMSFFEDFGDDLRDTIRAASLEFEQNARGVAIVIDGVTVVGKMP